MKIRVFWIAFQCIAASVVLVSAIAASGEPAADPSLSPYFFVEDGDPSLDRFSLKKTDVRVNIAGVIAEIVVTQRYTNEGSRPINARYIFPASIKVAVHGMNMIIGEQIITARIKERGEAQKEFNHAKASGKSASLLKQQRPNVFSMNVANIMPGDTVDLELHYTELLKPTEGTYEFVYPTVVGPRYASAPEGDAAETERWIKSPYLPEGRRDETAFAISVRVSTGIPLSALACSTHATETVWENDSTATVALAPLEIHGGNRDYILKYRLAGKQIQSGLLISEVGEEKFFLLMVQPPERVTSADVPPREYVFVLDVSGSMHGFPLDTAKELMSNLLTTLKPRDRFNVILFSGASRLLSPQWFAATPGNVQRALELIDQERGGGGTELAAALKRSFALPYDEGFSRSVIIVTDGYIAAEQEVFALIENNLDMANVFSFGIGSSVNRYLIEGIARAGLGEPFVVTRPEEAASIGALFGDYVRSPLLTDVAVEFEGLEAYDIEPPTIPDLFARRPVTIFGKWRGRRSGTIRLTGTGGQEVFIEDFDVAKTAGEESPQALRYLWARERIARLSDFNSTQGNPAHKAEVTELGLTYNLLTPYTSFIAVQDVVRNTEGDSVDVTQALPLPLHISNLAVGGGMASVPEPDLPVMGAVAVLILIAGIVGRKARGKGRNGRAC